MDSLEFRERLVRVEEALKYLGEGMKKLEGMLLLKNTNDNEHQKDNDVRFKKLEEHRGMVIGAAIAASAIVTIIVNVIHL